MPVFRVNKERDYTVLSNHVFKDRTLSARAKGILVEMLSLPEDWDYTLKGLTTLFKDGLDSISSGIRELEERGYLVRERKRDDKGRWGDMEYIIFEKPQPVENHVDKPVGVAVENSENTAPFCASPTAGEPKPEIPLQDEPTAAEHAQLNTKESITKESNTYGLNPYQSIQKPALMDVMGYDEARERVTQNIDYDILCERYPQERLDEIVDIASEALCTRRSTFTLGKDVYPYSLVRDRLLRLNASHIQYILDCIDSNTTEIRNIKPYLLKTLINAPATMESYYTTKVNHDLHGGS